MPTLNWLNRAAAFRTAARVTYRLLEQVSVHTPLTPSPLRGEGGGEGLAPIHDDNFEHAQWPSMMPPRLQKVIDGEHGRIPPDVRFATLAAFIWQQETGASWSAVTSRPGTPYLGTNYHFNSC